LGSYLGGKEKGLKRGEETDRKKKEPREEEERGK